MFRRPLRGAMNRPAIPPALAAQLNQANQYLQNGQPARAAELFVSLAQEATTLGRPRQAGNLHAQAAHAWVDAGEEERALRQARAALAIFMRLGMRERAIRFNTHIIAHLKRKNFANSAQTLAVETDLPYDPASQPAVSEKHGSLPAVCPRCGAPLRSDSVEWIDAASAECDFCGSTIKVS